MAFLQPKTSRPRRSRTATRWRPISAGGWAIPALASFAMMAGVPEPAEAKSTNCAAKPRACGYPDGKTAGVKRKLLKKNKLRRVPEDVRSGKGWHWDSRGWVTINGTSAKFIRFVVDGTINVEASNVLIKNVKVTVHGDTIGIAIRHADNTKIVRSSIGPNSPSSRLETGIKDVYGDAMGTTVRKSEIIHTATGIQMGQGTIVANFIHKMAYSGDDHVNGITSNGSTKPLSIIRNTIFNEIHQTDAIGLFQDFGLEANRRIENNLLAGGGYTLYAGEGPSDASSYNIRVVGNRFSTHLFPKGGSYGPFTAFNSYGKGNVWSGNIWDHNKKKIPAH